MSQQRKQVFIDSSLWNHRWFDELPIEHQMAYLILWAESDNVGVWKPHFRDLNFKLKQDIDPQAFLDGINAEQKRVEVLENGDWWLIDYLPLQVRTLTPNNRPHVSYIEDLQSHDLLTRYAIENRDNVRFDVIQELENYDQIQDYDEKKKAKAAYDYLDKRGLVRPLQEACKTLERGWEGSKEKDKDQEEEKEQEKANNGVATNYLEATNPPESKSIENILKQLRKIIPENCMDVSELEFQGDVQTYLGLIESKGIKDPRTFLIAKARTTDWEDCTWDRWEDKLTQAIEEGAPF